MASVSTSATIASATTETLSPSESALIASFEHAQHVEEAAYLALQVVGGQVLLPILLFTVLFSKRVASRGPVFVNFAFTWIIFSIVYSLVLYRGRSTIELQLEPSSNLCLIQASLINGVQVLTSCSTLALIINVWRVITCTINKGPKTVWTLRQTIALVVFPYLGFVLFTTLSMILGSPEGLGLDGEPISDNLAIPSTFYCYILLNTNTKWGTSLVQGFRLNQAVFGFNCGIALITVCFEVLVARKYYRNRHYINRVISSSSLHTLFFLSRLVIFSAYRLVSQGLILALMINPIGRFEVGISAGTVFNGQIDLFQAALPLIAFLIFGSQKDVLRVWCFWRRPKGLRSGGKVGNSSLSA